jgi:predicted transcriptional regulator
MARQLKDEGFSQQQMAEALGISGAAMSRLLRGQIPVSLREDPNGPP